MTKGALALGVIAILSMPLASRADLLDGVLTISGTAELSENDIAFGNGQFVINSMAQQGGFTALAGTDGIIQSIVNPPYAPGVVFPTPDFITFDLAPNITITLLVLNPGFDGTAGCTLTPAAAGQLCTPGGSALNFQNTSATSSSLSFGVSGIEVDSLTDTSTDITGLFTLPFVSESFQSVLATINAGGTATTSFSAQFTTLQPTTPAVPEPSTLVGLIAGLGMIVGTVARRKKLARLEQ
jgi:PEP-CTERM motif